MPRNKNMQMIIIEGPIGVGKSTLTSKLAEELNAKPYFEPVETNPYLELYYADRKRYALPMQFYLMSQRFAMHQEAIEHIWKTKQPVIFDRSIYGDGVFAKRNWLDGNMSDLDYDNYMKMRNVMTKFLMVPHVTLYLDCNPETCLNRINSRARGCESGIPISYLKGLNELYSELMYDMKVMGSRVIKVDYNEFKEVSDIIELIKHG